jgi:hypothetical protein
MSVREFMQKDNVNMLWDVISDEENFKFLTRDKQSTVYQLFKNNIQGFFDNEKMKTDSLVDINKKYILLIINHIKKNYNIQPSKITIYQEPIKESITYEDIQNDRRSKFDRDLNRKQQEFEDIINVKVPPVPEFADKDKDQPIREMDKILKEMQAARNYEIENITRNQNSSAQLGDWLKPQETSLKTEKFNPVEQSQVYSRFKFLNSLDQDIDEGVKEKKSVSFSNIEEIKTFNIEDEEDDNIFSKLKKIPNKQTENIKLEMHEPTLSESKEDRIAKLEREVKNISTKMDRILELLSSKF